MQNIPSVSSQIGFHWCRGHLHGCLCVPSLLISLLPALPSYPLPAATSPSHTGCHLACIPRGNVGFWLHWGGGGQSELSHSRQQSPLDTESFSCLYFPFHMIISRHFYIEICLTHHSWSRNKCGEDNEEPTPPPSSGWPRTETLSWRFCMFNTTVPCTEEVLSGGAQTAQTQKEEIANSRLKGSSFIHWQPPKNIIYFWNDHSWLEYYLTL